MVCLRAYLGVGFHATVYTCAPKNLIEFSPKKICRKYYEICPNSFSVQEIWLYPRVFTTSFNVYLVSYLVCLHKVSSDSA